jgi:hypothetical protein
LTPNPGSSKLEARRAELDIRAMRLAVWREWEKLWSDAMAPGFTGEIGVRVSVKQGRPGQPRFTFERYGLTE